MIIMIFGTKKEAAQYSETTIIPRGYNNERKTRERKAAQIQPRGRR